MRTEILRTLLIVLIHGCMISAGVTEKLVWGAPFRGAGFETLFDEKLGGIISLKCSEDRYKTDYLKPGSILGDVTLRYRRTGKSWITVQLHDVASNFNVEEVSEDKIVVRYKLPEHLELIKIYRFEESRLIWQIECKNQGKHPIEIGDLALPLRMNTDFVAGDLQDQDAIRSTYQNRLNRHRLIAGHGSFVYWMRASGVGPFLVMLPSRDTRLEYFDSHATAFIHSARSGTLEERGTWRHQHTGVLLSSLGGKNDSVRYTFSFTWANDYDGVRDTLYKNYGYDVHVIPGMTLPADLSARIAIRTRNTIHSVQPEYPEETRVHYQGEDRPDVHIYEVTFSRLGENLLKIVDTEGRVFQLEFFSTEPLETLFRKRARFIALKQQHRNDKWYNGLFSLWDMSEKVLRGPENTGGLQDYMVGGSDDPSNSKGAYLSEKNVILPDADEIAALEYYLEHFVWGGLQRTNEEYPHAYGIYGSENWFLNRTNPWGTDQPDRILSYERMYHVPQGTGLGAERLWRSFDYTTHIMLYYNMYRIAKQYPHLVHYLDANAYLERAFGTAQAYFQVPYSIHMVGKPLWSFKGYCDWAYKLGNFHERYIIDLFQALREEGKLDEADWLKAEWEKKVKYFIYDDPFPFGSEFVFDRTAFESTQSIAGYAVENPLQPDNHLWFDKNLNRWYSHPEVHPKDAIEFMKRQIDANIAMRGWLETSYYYLGSARVGTNTLDYMSQMAGWSILDYGLYYSDEPAKYIRLGYASLLSSWALVNSGTPESDHGYWFPGKANDGAAGWSFQTQKFGRTWALGASQRGIWPCDGEIDHGLAGGIRAASTIVIDDPIFGVLALGGSLESEAGRYSVIPRDGARRRLHFLVGQHRFHLLLNTDGFSKAVPILLKDDLRHIEFHLECRSNRDHLGTFEVSGLPDGQYAVLINGQRIYTFASTKGSKQRCSYTLSESPENSVTVTRLD